MVKYSQITREFVYQQLCCASASRIRPRRSLEHSTVIYEGDKPLLRLSWNMQQPLYIGMPACTPHSLLALNVYLSCLVYPMCFNTTNLGMLYETPTCANASLCPAATLALDSNDVVIHDLRRPLTPLAVLQGHSQSITAIDWAPHSAFLCSSGMAR